MNAVIVANERRASKGAGIAGRDLVEAGFRASTEKAFVVQLIRETCPSLEPFAGRVEHIASGRRLLFGDFVAFRAAMTRLLSEATRAAGDRAAMARIELRRISRILVATPHRGGDRPMLHSQRSLSSHS